MDIVVPALAAYAEAHTTPAAAHLDRLFAETHESLELPQMLTGPVEGRFLETLVFLVAPRLVVELGTYSGYSAISMAAALPPGGRIVTCEVSERHAEFARRHIDAAGLADRIDVRLGPGLETIAGIDEPIDLAFIDADKEGYVGYYEALVPKLAPHGLIAADNTLRDGRVLEGGDVMAAFNDHVQNDLRTINVLLTVRDGVTLVRRA